MLPAELVDLLRRQGVQLVADGQTLRYRPASAVPPELRDALVAHKSDVLRLLEYETAVHEYDYLGARIDALADQAVEARKRGDEVRAARLAAEARRLVEGPYWRAGQRVASLAGTETVTSGGAAPLAEPFQVHQAPIG